MKKVYRIVGASQMQGAVSTEERLYRDKDWIANSPGLANGGVALAVVEPETVGWSKIASLLDDYGFLAFTAADKKTVFDQIRDRLGDEGALPFWDTFAIDASRAMPICEEIIVSRGGAYELSSSLAPARNTIEGIVSLNREVGVAPLPSWYVRGEGPPSIASWIRSPGGRIIACANGSMRFHRASRMAGTYYVGSVSVASSERGKGLGTMITATLIRDGLRAFDPKVVMGIAQPSNEASRAMLVSCGLAHDPSRATVVYNRSGQFRTR